jgi:tetratricopeptide (TPR) repeat protein
MALLKAESLRQPVILVLEDFQFSDKDTQDFVPRLKRTLLSSGESYPVGILVTSRPPGLGLAKDLIDVAIDLHAISTEATSYLIEISLGGAPAPDLVDLIVERSEGNPYFAEQILRYLQEENLIETSQAGWRLVREIEEAFLPGDIRAVLVARLDQLGRGVRESIQTASVLGREFELSLLEHMWRQDDSLQQHVAEAEQAAVWHPAGDLHYIFSHGLLRDAAYEMQMQSRRRELHALAVEALEQLYRDIKTRYAELAYHARYAGLNTKAQKYFYLAGKIAAEAYQNYQAIEYYNRALAYTPVDDQRTQFDILLERVEVFNRVGNRIAQLKDLETLELVAAQLKDQQRLIKAEILHARYCFITGDYPGTIELAQQVVTSSKEIGKDDDALGVYIVWSQALFRLGRLDEAQKYGADGLDLARRLGRRVDEGRSLSSLGLIALESKEPGLAQAYLEEALSIARETKERTLEARALANLANSAAFMRQDYATARAYYEQAYELAVELGDRYQQGIALSNISWVCGMLGEFSTAWVHHEQALSIAREIGNVYQETYALLNLSKVAEAQGKPEASVKYAMDATSLSKRAGDRTAEAWASLYLGYAYSTSARVEEAKLAFEHALDIRRELGQPSLITEPLAGLMQVALQMNNLVQARQLAEELMGYLSDAGTLEATEEPLRVYLACYEVLDRIADPRATRILDTARQLLDTQVSKINNEQARRTFVENVPWRRAIEQAWRSRKAKT